MKSSSEGDNAVEKTQTTKKKENPAQIRTILSDGVVERLNNTNIYLKEIIIVITSFPGTPVGLITRSHPSKARPN